MSPRTTVVVTGSRDRGERIGETRDGTARDPVPDNPIQHPRCRHRARTARAIVAAGILATAARLYQCDFCGSVDDLSATRTSALHRSLTPEERVTYLHEKGDAR